jgi:hypothetical protein
VSEHLLPIEPSNQSEIQGNNSLNAQIHNANSSRFQIGSHYRPPPYRLQGTRNSSLEIKLISNTTLKHLDLAYGTVFSTPGFALGADRGLCCRVVGCEPAESILNEYTLEILSLIGDLLVAVTAPYLKDIVALVIPGAVALYITPERFGLNIGDCPPGFKVTCCALQDAVVVA